MNKIAFTFGMMLALAANLAAADQVYKWVDAQGQVHYSSTPPASTKVQAKQMTVYVPPPDPQSLQNSQQLQQAQSDKDKAAADAAAKNKPDASAEAQKKAHCDDLRSRLVVLQQSGRAATTDAQGKLTYLDDDARAKQEAAIQDEINKDCSGGNK